MSLFDSLKDWSISTKGVIISLAGHFQLFFIALYLFKPDIIPFDSPNIFIDLRFYFLMCLCLAFSVVWFVMSFLANYSLVQCFEAFFREMKASNHKLHICSFVLSNFILMLFIYLNKTELHWPFLVFFKFIIKLASYSFAILFFVVISKQAYNQLKDKQVHKEANTKKYPLPKGFKRKGEKILPQ